MNTPLVTVVCLCYNHSEFVGESIRSVFAQTYKNVQLVVVDDCSTDNSVEVIKNVIGDHSDVTFLIMNQNLGNCSAFNRGLAVAKGEFIIDLAADDVLTSTRIESGIKAFSLLGKEYGVHFSDAELIDESGHHLGFHSTRFPHNTIPQGDIYKELIKRYFICSPSMMIRARVLIQIGGYDENLAYEDFDFWIRSSRDYKYFYSPEVLIRRRQVRNSMSGTQYQFKSAQLASTFVVCEKISELNRNADEDKALAGRIRYELRRALQVGRWELVWKYCRLLFR